jgi:hypothetical protein
MKNKQKEWHHATKHKKKKKNISPGPGLQLISQPVNFIGVNIHPGVEGWELTANFSTR